MTKSELLNHFYDSFSKGNFKGMMDCYHQDMRFEDPAFGKLEGDRVKAMWKMLLSKQKESNLQLSYTILNDHQVEWTAHYNYGPKKVPVTNRVTATFRFKEGKIIEHTDAFNLWTWSKQALGTGGYLLGWTNWMRKKIQQTTNNLLDDFMQER